MAKLLTCSSFADNLTVISGLTAPTGVATVMSRDSTTGLLLLLVCHLLIQPFLSVTKIRCSWKKISCVLSYHCILPLCTQHLESFQTGHASGCSRFRKQQIPVTHSMQHRRCQSCRQVKEKKNKIGFWHFSCQRDTLQYTEKVGELLWSTCPPGHIPL